MATKKPIVLSSGSDMIEEFDPAMLALADDLVKGVSN